MRGVDARFDIGDIVEILIPSYFYKSEREIVDKISGEFLGCNTR